MSFNRRLLLRASAGALAVPAPVIPEAELPGVTAGAFTIGYGVAVAIALATGWLDRIGIPALGIGPIAFAAAAVAVIGWKIAAMSSDRPGERGSGCERSMNQPRR